MPPRNYSTMDGVECNTILPAMMNIATSLSTDIDPSILAGEEAMREVDPHNPLGNDYMQYVERINKAVDDPGNLTWEEQKKEIGECMVRLSARLLGSSNEIASQIDNEIFEVENPTDEQKEQRAISFKTLFGGTKGFFSNEYIEKISPAIDAIEKGMKRAEEMIREDGYTVIAMNLQPVKQIIKNLRTGTMAGMINGMDPMVRVPEANFRGPEKIDREKDPLIPGKTILFTADEIEEKAEAFPIHKAINAQYELKDIWREYLAEREKGPLSAEKEKAYWDRIDSCYVTIETITNDIKDRQKKDPTYADNNMRALGGQKTVAEAYEDSLTGKRSISPRFEHIEKRREAVRNGWPLNELGFYSGLLESVRDIEKHIDKVRDSGDVAQTYVALMEDYKNEIYEKVIGHSYENDPQRRAELYSGLAEKMQAITAEEKRVKSLVKNNVALTQLLGMPTSGMDSMDFGSGNGARPLDYVAKAHAKEAQIEAAHNARKQEIEALEGKIDPIVYDDLKSLVDAAPLQEYRVMDNKFVARADTYLNSIGNELTHEIEMIKNGRETTLAAKSGLSSDQSIESVRKLLNARDSFFHWDSSQYKAIKEGLNKIHKNRATDDDREKLKNDVKTWLTDTKYDRRNKHSKNQFDNNRFNAMLTLANELDPEWTKKNFAGMNTSVFHDDKAPESTFYNVHEFTDFMHRQMADGGQLPEGVDVRSKRWYKKVESTGQKGLVEEIIRLQREADYTEKDRLKAELSNIDKLTGLGNGGGQDKEMITAFASLKEYRNTLNTFMQDSESGQEEANVDVDKERIKEGRKAAINDLKAFLDNPENRKSKLFDKAVAAYGVMDPKGAHEHIKLLNEKKVGNKKVKPVSLQELEKNQGLDLGGRKAYNRRKAEIAPENNRQLQK